MDPHFIQLRPDLTIHQSDIFHTNTGIIKTAEGFALVDPTFTQADFERIAAFIGQETVLAGFSTHAHYDHLFWSSLFGDETPHFCSKGTLDYALLHQQELLNELAALEKEAIIINTAYFIDHLLHLTVISADLHVLNNINIAVYDIPGHMSGQTALLFPDYQVLFAADTLSDIEPPSIEGSRKSVLEYLGSLNKLEYLIQQVKWIVPGHGNPANPAEAKVRLEMDRRYLQALLALRKEDFAGDSGASAKLFLEQNQETRAETSDSWQMHLQNLDFARQWLLG